jgi:hypothetical protein
MSCGLNIPDVISYGREGKLRAISAIVHVPILGSHRASGTVRATQAVHADDEEARYIEGSSVATKQRAPPVTDIGTARQGMANDHGIVPVGRQFTFGGVRNRHILKCDTRFKVERGYDRDLLVWDQTRERVLRLRSDSFLDVFSHWSLGTG